ncbi:unnamed protein product [Rotaria socialis]|uniref:Uncharacterized protein n=1 Tax=Rotaria socialis TaxID=392032 RepID=A0A820V4X3_9BILA|nr:unnamed protein product [Rotaria socialis]CAF4495603.1 unnamed protein product [Rotaria socialis]
MAMTTSCGYEPMRSGTTILCYINRDGLPLSDRCTERMWSFCMEQYAKNVTDIEILRNQIDNYPPVTHPDPPYHIATSTRLTVAEKLQQIQNYIQRLEYNYTGMQFFYVNPNRSIYGLMDKARYIMTESLPIKCFEAFLIGLYLTTGIVGLDRFNISFKTRFNSVVYRHVILGVKFGQIYGAVGISRRSDLAYKPLNGSYDSLSKLIDDFIGAYRNYGHTVLRVKIGLPIVHDLKSFVTINWKALSILPSKTSKSDYDRELDKITRTWRQLDMHMNYRSVVPLASLVKPACTLITSPSVPTRLQSVSIRQNRGASLNCRQSALSKTPTTIIHEENSTDKDQAVSYAIRV